MMVLSHAAAIEMHFTAFKLSIILGSYTYNIYKYQSVYMQAVCIHRAGNNSWASDIFQALLVLTCTILLI